MRGILTSIASASFTRPVPLLHDGRVPSLSLSFSRSGFPRRSRGNGTFATHRRLPRAPLRGIPRAAHSSASRRTEPAASSTSCFRGDRNRDNVHTCPTASAQLNFRLLRPLLFILTWRGQVRQVAPPSDRPTPCRLPILRRSDGREGKSRRKKKKSALFRFSPGPIDYRAEKISMKKKKEFNENRSRAPFPIYRFLRNSRVHVPLGPHWS